MFYSGFTWGLADSTSLLSHSTTSSSCPLSSDFSFKGTSSRREHLKTQEGRGEKGGLAASREELLFGVKCTHCSKPAGSFRISQTLLQRRDGKRKLSFSKPTFLQEVWRTALFTHWWKHVPEKSRQRSLKTFKNKDLRSKTSNTMTQMHCHSFSTQTKKRQNQK